MPKKKPVSQDASVLAKTQSVPLSEEVAPDAETQSGVDTTHPVTSESESIEGTRALPTRPADPQAATAGRPTGSATRPVSIEDLNKAEKQFPEDSTQAIPKRDTGPLTPEPTPTARYKTVAQNLERRPGMPAWAWALVGGAGALALAAGGMFLYLRLKPSENPDAAILVPEPQTPPVTQASPPEPEVPIALRSYMDKAKTGDDRAMVMLAVMYTQGLNVAKDEKEGRKWYEKAAALKNKSAEKWLKENPTK